MQTEARRLHRGRRKIGSSSAGCDPLRNEHRSSAQNAPVSPLLGIHRVLERRPWRAANLGDPSASLRLDWLKEFPDAEVMIDGESWNASAPGERLLGHLGDGRHHVEIRRHGFRNFSTDIGVRAGETASLNVSLTPKEGVKHNDSVQWTLEFSDPRPLARTCPCPSV